MGNDVNSIQYGESFFDIKTKQLHVATKIRGYDSEVLAKRPILIAEELNKPLQVTLDTNAKKMIEIDKIKEQSEELLALMETMQNSIFNGDEKQLFTQKSVKGIASNGSSYANTLFI